MVRLAIKALPIKALPIAIGWMLIAIGAACYEKRSEQLPMVTAADEMAAITRLQAIALAEQAYSVGGDGSYADMEQLLDKGVISNPAQGKLSVYRFDVRVTAHGFQATAVPEKYGVTGKRSFYVDETRVMRTADKGGVPASSTDPALQ